MAKGIIIMVFWWMEWLFFVGASAKDVLGKGFHAGVWFGWMWYA